MHHEPTSADYLARARWVRMCMALLLLQDDMRVAREIQKEQPLKFKRW